MLFSIKNFSSHKMKFIAITLIFAIFLNLATATESTDLVCAKDFDCFKKCEDIGKYNGGSCVKETPESDSGKCRCNGNSTRPSRFRPSE